MEVSVLEMTTAGPSGQKVTVRSTGAWTMGSAAGSAPDRVRAARHVSPLDNRARNKPVGWERPLTSGERLPQRPQAVWTARANLWHRRAGDGHGRSGDFPNVTHGLKPNVTTQRTRTRLTVTH